MATAGCIGQVNEQIVGVVSAMRRAQQGNMDTMPNQEQSPGREFGCQQRCMSMCMRRVVEAEIKNYLSGVPAFLSRKEHGQGVKSTTVARLAQDGDWEGAAEQDPCVVPLVG